MTDFRSLGVSEAVCGLLTARGIESPFQIQTLVIPEALRGGDVLAKSPTGSGKTLAFAIPILERLDPTQAEARRARARADARALRAGDRGVRADRRRQDQGRVRVRRRAAEGAGDRGEGGARDRRDAGPPAGSRRPQARLARRCRRCSCSTRPTGCSTWGSSRRSTASSACSASERQTMFFSATLDGEVGELARRYTHFPARFEGELPADRRSGEIDHRFVPVTTDTKVATLVELLNDDRARPRARLRPHEGGRRPPRREAAPPRRRRGRDSRRQGPGAARAGARALRRRQGAHARRHRRRRARARRRRHHARDQLRPARGARRLHPPRRPHRSRRQGRRRDHARAARAAGRRLARRTAPGSRRASSRRPACRSRSRGVVYTSRRRGGRSKW